VAYKDNLDKTDAPEENSVLSKYFVRILSLCFLSGLQSIFAHKTQKAEDDEANHPNVSKHIVKVIFYIMEFLHVPLVSSSNNTSEEPSNEG